MLLFPSLNFSIWLNNDLSPDMCLEQLLSRYHKHVSKNLKCSVNSQTHVVIFGHPHGQTFWGLDVVTGQIYFPWVVHIVNSSSLSLTSMTCSAKARTWFSYPGSSSLGAFPLVQGFWDLNILVLCDQWSHNDDMKEQTYSKSDLYEKSWIWAYHQSFPCPHKLTSSSITGLTSKTLFKGTQACEEETVSPAQFILEECSQSILFNWLLESLHNFVSRIFTLSLNHVF